MKLNNSILIKFQLHFFFYPIQNVIFNKISKYIQMIFYISLFYEIILDDLMMFFQFKFLNDVFKMKF